MLKELFLIAVSPITLTYSLIHLIVYNTIYLPLIYLVSICVLIPAKLPLKPISYLLELDSTTSPHLLASPLSPYSNMPYDTEWIINQFEMFLSTTFHFLMCSVYIGLGIGLITGLNLTLISWFLTLSSVESDVVIPRVKVKFEEKNNDGEVKETTDKNADFDLDLDEMERKEMQRKAKFAYLESLRRKEQEQLAKIMQLKNENRESRESRESTWKTHDLNESRSSAAAAAAAAAGGGGGGGGAEPTSLDEYDYEDEEVFVYPTPKSDFELDSTIEGLRNRVKREKKRHHQHQGGTPASTIKASSVSPQSKSKLKVKSQQQHQHQQPRRAVSFDLQDQAKAPKIEEVGDTSVEATEVSGSHLSMGRQQAGSGVTVSEASSVADEYEAEVKEEGR
ncbi:uncharacterized protein LODBEIA_P17280 [Lodderomyces beijingensis]|uniref:Uncharacterized protein n=1 Tax=Lodderomyces beijingensis TaxID=1775926 RepID=A0ABP0ZHZ9_9ASCO